ncbi:UDP-N-acetyl-D-glucosamine 6-dehydrogenase [Aquicella siphonis]|uniref:UDP-N-acetyl-D-glucosamine 6-dehydrogenase n=1 Tax=Aquicella siphonis TaxID=254247 RepID=A0A5E4PGY7_9COXI|nr:nucleotide sugar dehydrogenase [Aquicella siphonis]VVC75727.1 UDP-N-acetyl-D-glucosamine 6-dehydrogenase [Aquicella siphonis]
MAHRRKISVVGLGYVGLTIAAAFGKAGEVVGYDINQQRINNLKNSIDTSGEISSEELKKTNILYTTNPDDLKQADFHIITVLTPIDKNKLPDLSQLLSATETLAKRLKKGDIVVYEATVYPGATEEKCIPTLEKHSGLKCGVDFQVGYSPERVNPGDKEHTFYNIIKIISATNDETVRVMSDVYKSVVKAGVYPVSSIRVAEATKVVENTQRDLNISLINEIAIILSNLGMDSAEVIAASRTKWNYLPFYPGLVGGHCIGVNSYYLTYKSQESGYYPEVIHAGRRVNEYIPKFITERIVKKLIQLDKKVSAAKVAVLGITYKENLPDIHDTKVINLIREFETYNIKVKVHDPIANKDEVRKEFGIDLSTWDSLTDLDVVIIAVADKEYMQLHKPELTKMLKSNGIIMDVKGILNQNEYQDTDITIMRL